MLAYFLRNLQNSLANNLRIPRIKNAKSSGYCNQMNTIIEWDFQICISVTLTKNYLPPGYALGIFRDFQNSYFSKRCWQDACPCYVKNKMNKCSIVGFRILKCFYSSDTIYVSLNEGLVSLKTIFSILMTWI